MPGRHESGALQNGLPGEFPGLVECDETDRPGRVPDIRASRQTASFEIPVSMSSRTMRSGSPWLPSRPVGPEAGSALCRPGPVRNGIPIPDSIHAQGPVSSIAARPAECPTLRSQTGIGGLDERTRTRKGMIGGTHRVHGRSRRHDWRRPDPPGAMLLRRGTVPAVPTARPSARLPTRAMRMRRSCGPPRSWQAPSPGPASR